MSITAFFCYITFTFIIDFSLFFPGFSRVFPGFFLESIPDMMRPSRFPSRRTLVAGAGLAGWLVAAGALVPPNKRLPTGQLMMGNPGRVARALTEADRAWIVHSWNAYVRRAREFMAEPG